MKQTKPTIRDFRSALSDGFFTRLKEKSEFIFGRKSAAVVRTLAPSLGNL